MGNEIRLKYHNLWIDPKNKLIITYYEDKDGTWKRTVATREENPENWTEATEEGYEGEDRVWKAFVDHEILHCLIPQLIKDEPSSVLLNEMGIEEHQPYWKRLLEEVLVIQFQLFLTKKELLWPLYNSDIDKLVAMEKEFLKIKKQLSDLPLT